MASIHAGASRANALERQPEAEAPLPSNPDDLEAGSTNTQPQSNALIDDLPIADRIFCGSSFVAAVLQVSFDNPNVKDQLSAARWIAFGFFIFWVLIVCILFCRHIAAFRRHAKAIILSALGLSILAIHFLDLQTTQVVTYLPLIINISLAMPFTGSLLESLSLDSGGL